MAIQAYDITADFISPYLSNFVLDLDKQQVVLYFSEIIQGHTFTPVNIALQSLSFDNSTSLGLGGSFINPSNSSTISVMLSSSDRN